MAVLLVGVLDRFVLRQEERRLHEFFGRESVEYAARVRRWLQPVRLPQIWPGSEPEHSSPSHSASSSLQVQFWPSHPPRPEGTVRRYDP